MYVLVYVWCTYALDALLYTSPIYSLCRLIHALM